MHPLVTLIEKLDALSRRYNREVIEADSLVRHYEDAASIILALGKLPAAGTSALALAEDMLAEKGTVVLLSVDEPSLLLDDPDKRARVSSVLTRRSRRCFGAQESRSMKHV